VAVALGAVTGAMIRFGRIHQRALAVLSGTLIGAVGLWASWVVWIWRVLHAQSAGISLFKLAISPGVMYRLAKLIYLLGAWKYGETVVRGPQLLTYWIGEALIILLGCTLVAASVGKPGLFCAACGKPCKRIGGLGRYDGSSTSEVRPHLEAHDFNYLLALGPVRDENDPEVLLDLECCPCGQTNLFGARRVAWEDNGQGRLAVKERTLVAGLMLTPEQVEEVRSLKARLAEQEQESSEATADEPADSSESADRPSDPP
jgi:hypothetical protein